MTIWGPLWTFGELLRTLMTFFRSVWRTFDDIFWTFWWHFEDIGYPYRTFEDLYWTFWGTLITLRGPFEDSEELLRILFTTFWVLFHDPWGTYDDIENPFESRFEDILRNYLGLFADLLRTLRTISWGHLDYLYGHLAMGTFKAFWRHWWPFEDFEDHLLRTFKLPLWTFSGIWWAFVDFGDLLRNF